MKKNFVCFVVIVFVMSFINICYAGSDVIKSGETNQIKWTLDGEGTLTISLLDNVSDWTLGFASDNINDAIDPAKRVACPWGIYSWDENGRAKTVDYSNIKKIVIAEGIKTIPPYSFFSNFYSSPYDELKAGVAHTGLKEIVFPSTLTTISYWSFTYSTVETLKIPKNVIKIDTRAFSGKATSNHTLKQLVFEDGSKLEEIGTGAFDYQSGLRTIVFPDSLAKVGGYAFRGYGNLDICFLGNAPIFSYEAFQKTFNSRNACIFYKKNAIGFDTIDSSTVGFSSMYELPEESPQYFSDFAKFNSENLINGLWFYGNRTLYILGNGDFGKDFCDENTPWNLHKDEIDMIQLSDGIDDVTSIFGLDCDSCLFSKIYNEDEFCKVYFSNYSDTDKIVFFFSSEYDTDGFMINTVGKKTRTLKNHSSGIIFVKFTKSSVNYRNKVFLWDSVGNVIRNYEENNKYAIVP